jgi:hypothetical protein
VLVLLVVVVGGSGASCSERFGRHVAAGDGSTSRMTAGVGEDPDDVGASLDLLVEPLD